MNSKNTYMAWMTLALLVCSHMTAVWLHGAELLWEVAIVSVLIAIAGVFILLSNKPFNEKSLNSHTADKKIRGNQPKSIRLFLAICGFWLCYLFVTTIPMPIHWVTFLSPESAMWQTKISLNTELATLSIAPSMSRLEAFEFASIILLFAVTYSCLRQIKDPLAFVYCLIIIGLSVSLYGLINHITQGRYEWVEAIPPWDSPWATTIRGTFSYKNQFAVYLAMLLPLIFGLIVDRLDSKKREFKRHSYWKTLVLIASSRIGALALAALLVLSVFMQADSRGAILAFVASSAIVLIKHRVTNIKRKQSANKLLPYTAIACVVTIIFVNSVSFERFKKFGIEDNGRSELHTVAKNIFSDYPLIGSGAGTYPLLQHNYKPVSLGNTSMSKRAHSDYLELLATQGLVGAVLLLIAFGILLKPVFYGRSKRHPSLLLGCQCSLLILMIHSSFDFNYATYYLPALFFTVIAIAYNLIGHKEKVK